MFSVKSSGIIRGGKQPIIRIVRTRSGVEERGIDRDAFDGLARLLASSPSRRAELAALLGTGLARALAATDDGARAAHPDHAGRRLLQRKAQRRRKHCAALRRGRRGGRGRNKGSGGPGGLLRGISVRIINPPNAIARAIIEGIETRIPGDCTLLGTIDLPINQDALFDTSNTALALQIKRHYLLIFVNLALRQPYVVAYVSGSADLCPTYNTEVFVRTSLAEGESVSIPIEGHVFTIRRNDDKTDFKYFDLTLPPVL